MDKTKMITSPGQCFTTVQELVDSKTLNQEEKIAALLNWKSICEHYKESTYEGMAGGEKETPLAAVLTALRSFEATS